MYQGEDIKENIAARKLNIIKGFVETDDIFEKAAQSKQVGQTKVGSDGVTRVWTQLPNGKYDWRRKKTQDNNNQSSDNKDDILSDFKTAYKNGKNEKQIIESLQLKGYSKKQIDDVFEQVTKKYKNPSEILNDDSSIKVGFQENPEKSKELDLKDINNAKWGNETKEGSSFKSKELIIGGNKFATITKKLKNVSTNGKNYSNSKKVIFELSFEKNNKMSSMKSIEFDKIPTLGTISTIISERMGLDKKIQKSFSDSQIQKAKSILNLE